MNRAVWLIAALVLIVVAAIGGVGIGRLIWSAPKAPGAELHHFLHTKLDLNASQSARLEMLERRYSTRRAALEAEMRSDNASLARAIEAEHGYGPRVAAAVNASHGAMGNLQKETLAHIFAMRQLLRPDQAARFDAAVAQSLTNPSH